MNRYNFALSGAIAAGAALFVGAFIAIQMGNVLGLFIVGVSWVVLLLIAIITLLMWLLDMMK